MADQSVIDILFTENFNKAKALYDDDRLDECVAKALELLEDPAIPRYHRMKTLALLSATLEDWYEANGCLEEAEELWILTRRWHPEGQDDVVDEFMAEIRTSLDQLAKALMGEEPEDYDVEDDVESIVNAHDDQVADTQAMIQGMEINEDDVDMDSGGEDVAAGNASQVQVQPVQEPLPGTEKYKPPHLRPLVMDDGRRGLRSTPSSGSLRARPSSRNLQANCRSAPK